MKTALLLLLAGCAVDPAPPLAVDADAMPRLYWTSPIVCGDTISHPCPWLVHTTMMIEGTTATSTPIPDATALDPNGYPTDHRPALVEDIVAASDGRVILAQRGDDAGLRLEATLDPELGGDVSYLLFNVAGTTTFHVGPRCAAPCVLTDDGVGCISPETGKVCQ